MPKYDCDMGDPLHMLAEECAEVIQAIMKAQRFGLGGVPGHTGMLPREEIAKEVGDILACIELVRDKYDFLFPYELEIAKEKKLSKISQYFRKPQTV